MAMYFSCFQLALCQKQLKAADEQISELKQRLLTIRESHDDIKEDFAKVSKEVSSIKSSGMLRFYLRCHCCCCIH